MHYVFLFFIFLSSCATMSSYTNKNYEKLRDGKEAKMKKIYSKVFINNPFVFID